MSCPGVCDCLEILLIILLPPLGVAVSGSQKNIPAGRLCVDTFLNFLLWLFFYIPGLQEFNVRNRIRFNSRFMGT